MTLLPVNHQSFYPFIFQNIRLKEACWLDDEPYFTRRAIGEWLEYSPKTQDRAIAKIIERNSHINQFSVLVKLTSADGKKYEQNVYNPIGFQLIVFESRQPKAKAYKIMVAHLVYAFMKGDVQPPRSLEMVRAQIQCEEASALKIPAERAIAVNYLAEYYKKHRGTVYRWIQRIDQGESLQRKPNPLKGKRRAVGPEDMEIIRRMVEENPGITVKDIRKQMPYLTCSSATISTIKGYIKEQVTQRIIQRLKDAAVVNTPILNR